MNKQKAEEWKDPDRIIIDWEEIEGKLGKDGQPLRKRVMTCMRGQYRIWPTRDPDRPGFRWSMNPWPNDGMGISTHGRESDLVAVYEACKRNRELREELAAVAA